MPTIYIEDYTAKSFVVRGETREYKDALKAMGGKWNPTLTDKQTGTKFGAWLFWSDKRKEIDDWFENGCPDVEGVTRNPSSPTHTFGSSGGLDRQTALTIKNLEEKVDRMSKMLESICEIHDLDIPKLVEKKSAPIIVKPQKVLKPKVKTIKTQPDAITEFDSGDDNEDEKITPYRRLLKKTK